MNTWRATAAPRGPSVSLPTPASPRGRPHARAAASRDPGTRVHGASQRKAGLRRSPLTSHGVTAHEPRAVAGDSLPNLRGVFVTHRSSRTLRVASQGLEPHGRDLLGICPRACPCPSRVECHQALLHPGPALLPTDQPAPGSPQVELKRLLQATPSPRATEQTPAS